MASTRWACITAISLLLSLGMSAAQRSLLMRGATGPEATELTDFDLHGGIAGTLASSSKGGATASSDMGSFGQDVPGEARPNHRDLSMVDGWDMDPIADDSGDRPPNAHDNPVVHNEPAPIPRFPDDQYGPPLSQWQGEFMYCSPMSCQGRKEDYGAGDCAGFSMSIEYTPPPPLGQPGVSRKPVYSPNGANPDGHAVPFAEPAAFPPESSAFPPESYATKTSDILGGTWEEPTMPGH